MSSTHQQLGLLLDRLELEMRAQLLWTDQIPKTEALSSQTPFCYDTLSFDDWLQWVFTPQMRQLISMQLPLPSTCSIAPMAELTYKNEMIEMAELITLLGEIDQLLTDNPDKPC